MLPKAPKRPQIELVTVETGCAILARRVVQYFDRPNIVIDMSSDARLLFTGLQACFNAQAAVQRTGPTTSKAARQGTDPWAVALLAGANVVFEIALGTHEDTAAYARRELRTKYLRSHSNPMSILRPQSQAQSHRAL